MYPKIHVTNEVDFKIREKLDGLEQIIHADPAKAAQGFKDLMRANLKSDKKAQSPRARFGLARCYKTLAQKDQVVYVRNIISLNSVQYIGNSIFNVYYFIFKSVGKKEEALNYEDLAMHSFCRVLQMRNVPRLLLMQSGRNDNTLKLTSIFISFFNLRINSCDRDWVPGVVETQEPELDSFGCSQSHEPSVSWQPHLQVSR